MRVSRAAKQDTQAPSVWRGFFTVVEEKEGEHSTLREDTIMKQTTMEEFKRIREEGNRRVLEHAGTSMKRLYHIDAEVYKEGALPAKTKELIGLVASLVLRCDDCVTYHLHRCREQGVDDTELEEALVIGYTVGGSITVPHLRRAFGAWDELE